MNTGAADADFVLGGRYRLISPVGTGGMAVVWQARDEVLGRTVAVKVLSAEYAGDDESRGRIRHEARAAAALSHPNIAQVHDYGEAGAAGEVFPYVVMELVQGGTLLERLASGPVAPRYAMRICSEVAAALAAAHAEGLVHRDVKLANVMLSPTGAKVVDFGIAAVAAPSGSGSLDSMVFGTPAYLAPERLIDDAVEPASDVYALGVVLYRLLAGQSPWTTESTTQMLTAHAYVEPAPLPPTSGVPDYVRELCDRCLAKDPAARPSAREAAALLAQGAGLRDVPEDAPAAADAPAVDAARVSSARGPVRRWAVAAAVLVAAAALVWPLLPFATKADAQPSAFGGDRASAPPSSTASPSSAAPPPVAPTRPPSGPPSTPAPRGRVVPDSRPSTTPSSARPTRTGSPTPSRPAPTTPTVPAQPESRVFTSAAGTVRATCPLPGTAQILSYTATEPYQVRRANPGPGKAPRVVFRNGASRVVMIVTCADSVPSLTLN